MVGFGLAPKCTHSACLQPARASRTPVNNDPDILTGKDGNATTDSRKLFGDSSKGALGTGWPKPRANPLKESVGVRTRWAKSCRTWTCTWCQAVGNTWWKEDTVTPTHSCEEIRWYSAFLLLNKKFRKSNKSPVLSWTYFHPFVSHILLPTDSQRLAGTKIASPAKFLAIHTHTHTHQSYTEKCSKQTVSVIFLRVSGDHTLTVDCAVVLVSSYSVLGWCRGG